MEIKKFKVIRKTNYKSDDYFIKFKRMIFGFIPMWFYLRNGHFNTSYKINRYFIHINIILITAFVLGVKSLEEGVGRYPAFLIILLFYNIFYIPEQIGSGRVYHYVDNNPEDFGKEQIKKFNLIHSKKNRKTETVFRNDDYDKKYYNIKIPRLNFKKFIY